nr:hypothetical protein [Tanacetum cinerariifolium]
EQNNEFNEQIKVLNEQNADLLDQTKVLKDQLQVKHVVIDTHVECHEKYAKLKEERYEYMIRYSALFENNKQHRKQIADQEVLFDKMSVELVELDKHVRDLKNTVLEKYFKISELEECVCNKDIEIEKCMECLNVCENKLHKMGQTDQTVHMIMPYKDNLYNGRKGIGFENLSYFEKAKDLRPTLYDEKVIGLGYTLMFLTHSDEALEIEKFKRSRENKIEFAYDYGNLNASYQTSSLKPYIPNVILEKIIIDLEDEVVSLLEKEKENLKTIESLKSKGFESKENAISESENQSENDCHVVEKECDKVENPKVIAPGMFKLSVSQSVSPMSMSKSSCDSKNVKKSKRNVDNNNQAQQIPKRQNVAQAYTVGTGERKEYAGTLSMCNKCKFHHNGPCTTKCADCKKVCHLTRDCWNPTATNNQKTITCYECENQGHYKSDFPKLKNQKHKNQAEGTRARGMVYALGGEETNQDLDGIEDDINA